MRRQAAMILGLLLGLAAAPASAQFVSRDEVTLSGLTRASDIVTLGEVKEVQTIGEGRHEALLVRVSPQQILKGPEQPGEALIFLYRNMMPSLSFEVGESPLLFLGQLEKDDLRCTDCGKTWDQVHDLPDGNYYRVVGANWGKLDDGATFLEFHQETLRLEAEKDVAGLKDHLMIALTRTDSRLAVDASIDLLSNADALGLLDVDDATVILEQIQLETTKFHPLESIVTLAGHTRSAQAGPVLVQTLRLQQPPDGRVLAAALTRLSEAGQDIVAPLRAELATATPADQRGRLLRVIAATGETDLTDDVLALVEDAEVGKKALLTLGDLKDAWGIPALVGTLDDSDLARRKTAAVALAFFLGDGLTALIEWEEAHPEDELAAFIHDLRRNPVKVRRSLREW